MSGVAADEAAGAGPASEPAAGGAAAGAEEESRAAKGSRPARKHSRIMADFG